MRSERARGWILEDSIGTDLQLRSGFLSSQDTVNRLPTGFQHGLGNMHPAGPAQIQASNGGEQSQMVRPDRVDGEQHTAVTA